MEELLKKIGITKPGKMTGGLYSIDIESYDEFSAIYNQLEQSNELIKDSDESYFNMDDAHVIYYTDNYQINLNGDLQADVYDLSVEKIKE